MPRRPALELRATEASELIRRLLERMTLDEMAERTRVSKRSLYRWLHEGRAPHPLILEGLRRLDAETE
jgi:excisionase family DNA binding protein